MMARNSEITESDQRESESTRTTTNYKVPPPPQKKKGGGGEKEKTTKRQKVLVLVLQYSINTVSTISFLRRIFQALQEDSQGN